MSVLDVSEIITLNVGGKAFLVGITVRDTGRGASKHSYRLNRVTCQNHIYRGGSVPLAGLVV